MRIKTLEKDKSSVYKKLPRRHLSCEEIEKSQTEKQKLGQRCRLIFERVRPELIDNYYNWFIAIEPDSENYVIAPTIEDIIKKVDDYFSDKNLKLITFQLNEMGVCGKI